MAGLSEQEQALLVAWLPHTSSLPQAWRGVRGLLAELDFAPLQPAEVAALLADLRAFADPLRGPAPSPLLARALREGRGVPGHLSPWEVSWLVVDALRAGGPPDPARVLERLGGSSRLNGLLQAVLCLESPDEARALVRGAAALPAAAWGERPGRAWAQWLAGGGPLPSEAPEGGYPAGLAEALAGRWTKAEASQEARFRKSYLKPIRRGPQALMLGQLLRQVIENAVLGAPPLRVLEASLAVLFGAWGRQTRDEWWDGTDVAARLPLLALVAQRLERDPLELLHAQRALNEHLVRPPARSFTPPPELLAALDRYEALLVEAQRSGRPVERVREAGRAIALRPM